MKINYESITKNIISSAVKTHLRTELRTHCNKVAKLQAKAWLRKNSKVIENAIREDIGKKLTDELPDLVKATVKAVSIKAPISRRRYY